ncbi:MAG: caspase family protein [Cellvibrionaceae bacterium]|nr:caspase family protein [Cellvibrionaceae bacterium]
MLDSVPDLCQFMRRSLWIVGSVVVLSACGFAAQKVQVSKVPDDVKVADLYIIDCLLPGQVRRLGMMTYLAPRRPIRTTAADCRLRGGEYIEYDRADYRTALTVWLPLAQEGDAEAQTYVGEIFEKGIGGEVDYISASQWYQKAASQGFARAKINLGYFYEKGLGVEKNIATALNWYRQASGLKDDQLVYSSEANEALEEQRVALTEKILLAEKQSSVFEKQLATLKAQQQNWANKKNQLEQSFISAQNANQQRHLEKAKNELVLAKREIDILSKLYAQADEDRAILQKELDAMPKLAFRNAPELPLIEPKVIEINDVSTIALNDVNFGRYFALIVGNQDYWYMDDLSSPLQDAKRLQAVLEEKYGFSTVLLADADEKTILNTLSDLYKQLGPQDNLLIYYAGHGNLVKSSTSDRQRGYWLPIDAQEDRTTNWISNTVISDHLDRLKARSILVMADSCYTGNMASAGSPFLLGSLNTQLSKDSVQAGLERRSRLVISSGGVKPVLDGTNGQHSMFAGSLIEILENNEQILRDNMLFSRLVVNVKRRNQQQNLDYIPEMRPIRAAGHSGGDFYFVPKAVAVERNPGLSSVNANPIAAYSTIY